MNDINGAVVSGDEVFMRVMTEVISPIYQLVVGIAIVYFFYGVFKFVVDLNDPEKKNNGKEHLLYGTIGLFILLSIGGVLPLFSSLLGGIFSF